MRVRQSVRREGCVFVIQSTIVCLPASPSKSLSPPASARCQARFFVEVSRGLGVNVPLGEVNLLPAS